MPHTKIIMNDIENNLYFPIPKSIDDIYHTNGQSLEDYLNLFKKEVLKSLLPIGSTMIVESSSYDPNIAIPGTTWVKTAQGKILIGRGYLDNDTTLQGILNEEGDLTGEYRTRLTVDTIPSHQHNLYAGAAATGDSNYDYCGSGTYQGVAYQGGGGSHENMMPYVVATIWTRIANEESVLDTNTLDNFILA